MNSSNPVSIDDKGAVAVGYSLAFHAGLVSATAVVCLLGLIVAKYVIRVRHPANSSWSLIRTNIDGVMLNLLIADLLMSFGAILDIKWVYKGYSYAGSYCNVQGRIQVAGETAVALFTLTISLLTFITIARGRAIKYSLAVWGGVALVVWVFVALLARVGTNEGFYQPSPYWCWISDAHESDQYLREYLWIWIAAFAGILLNIPLFFILRGNLYWGPGRGASSVRWRWRTLNSEHERADSTDTDVISIVSVHDGVSPFTLLWYPLAYAIVVTPLSIVRVLGRIERNWELEHGKEHRDDPVRAFIATFIFNLSGLINVLLILFTRTNVLGLGADSTNDLESVARVRDEEDSYHEARPPSSDRARFSGPRVTLRDGDPEFESGRNNLRGESTFVLRRLDAPRSSEQG